MKTVRDTGEHGLGNVIACRQTACRHCGQDIENFWPYRKGEWRDRGNNRTCPYPGKEGQIHAPVKT